MTVRFQDLGRLHASVGDELRAAFERVVATSGFVGGDEVASFERELAAAHSATAAAGCGSGTDALALTLRALGIGPGDDVVVPAMTFVATAEAVLHVGATPVLADVDDVTLLLTPDGVDAVRTDRTRAVLPVHLYGHVVPFDHLRAWRASGLVVVEDAAQAHLATEGGVPVGTAGHAACFSFYPGKNLGALGDGGAVMSADAALVEQVRRLRDHGRSSKYLHDQVGWCSRLDGLQAAFLRVKLAHLPQWTEARRRLADRYLQHLGDRLVPWTDGAVHHLLVARIPGGADRRDAVAARLAAAGISCGVHYPVALSHQPSLAPFARPCPVAEAAADEVLSLPLDPLMTDGEADLVAAELVGALAPAVG